MGSIHKVNAGESDLPARKRGRPAKKSLAQEVETAVVASALAELSDETPLSERLAAIYLGVSESLMSIWRAGKDAKGRPFKGPDFEKIMGAEAEKHNQPVRYRLGVLRAFARERTYSTSFEAAVKSGVLGWVSQPTPFYAELQQERRARLVLIADASDLGHAQREKLFMDLVEGRIQCVDMTRAEAASSRWAAIGDHKSFAEPWVAMLRDLLGGVEAAFGSTEIAAVARSAMEKEDGDGD